MKQIFVANPKGGCGKTTLATQIASHYASQGLRVALADHDPQQSALDWLKSRPNSCTDIQPLPAYRLPSDAPLPADADVVVHDMPAGCGAEQLAGLVRGHKLLIPIMPSPTDIKAGVRFLMALNRAGLSAGLNGESTDVALVANRVRTNTNYFKVLVSFLDQVNMPLLTSIRDTQNYIRAMDGGISVFDLPRSRVVRDMDQWGPILAWLG